MGLFDRLKDFPSLNEIKGDLGEQLTKYYSKAMYDVLVLQDVLINGAEKMTSQIDLLLIGEKGIYVVEVKMFNEAKIYGDGRKSTWYYYLGGKRYEIYSPIKQNKKHIEYLKSFLKDFGEIPCFSVITMVCQDIKVTNVNENSNNITTAVCTSLPSMNDAMKVIAEGKPIVFTEEKKWEIYNYILNNQHVGKEVRAEHKEKIKEIKMDQQELKNKNFCPYCKNSLVLRKGKYGDFYGCSNYPKCKFTQKI